MSPYSHTLTSSRPVPAATTAAVARAGIACSVLKALSVSVKNVIHILACN